MSALGLNWLAKCLPGTKQVILDATMKNDKWFLPSTSLPSSEESRKGNRHLNYSIEGSDLEGLTGKMSRRGGCNDSVDSWKSSRRSGERTPGSEVFQAKGSLQYLRN